MFSISVKEEFGIKVAVFEEKDEFCVSLFALFPLDGVAARLLDGAASDSVNSEFFICGAL